MKVLITGSKGQLGSELSRQIKEKKSSIGAVPEAFSGAEVVRADIDEFDIADRDAAAKFIGDGKFDVIINCAAFTNVDLCEAEPETAFRVNADAPGILAASAKETGAKLLHVSTDYVFSGDAAAPYREDSPTEPKTVYGKSKLQGEQRVLEIDGGAVIVRTAWLYGLTGKNFVKTMLSLARERGSLTVVNDQFGNPTNARDLAHHILKLVASGEDGIFHCTNHGVCSWFDFAAEIVRAAGLKVPVNPCTTAEFPRPAPRPAYSALENYRLGKTVGDEMRPWQRAVGEYVAELSAGVAE